MTMEEEKTAEIWDATTNRYVACIDIMGFKDLVLKSPHNEVYDLMKKINISRKSIEGVKWSDKKENLVKSTTYSDSIIIYSKDDSYDAFDVLVTTVSGLTNYLLKDGIPFKGAVAFGMMTLDIENSIFFGQPLIDAYLLEEEIYYYGILFHGTVDQQLLKIKRSWPAFTAHHNCPLKSGYAQHMTIYPMYALQKNDEKHKDRYEELTKSIKHLRLRTSGRLRKYIDNTEFYLASISSDLKRDY